MTNCKLSRLHARFLSEKICSSRPWKFSLHSRVLNHSSTPKPRQMTTRSKKIAFSYYFNTLHTSTLHNSKRTN